MLFVSPGFTLKLMLMNDSGWRSEYLKDSLSITELGFLSQLHLWQGEGLEIKLSPVASGSIIHAYVVKLQRNLWTLRLE